ncbi:hypothetical protein [Spiroplasma endosymbiont of Othius punctulatus]|uniref:hypothetical protein n=1 Tax=Spiroplasma endosymbiont of Othius punctulatus TaxID=3066289 RepID=UPI0030D342C6
MKKENKYKKDKKEALKFHNEVVQEKLEINSKDSVGYKEYKRTSFFTWYEWIIVIFLPWILFGLIVLICWAAGDIKYAEYTLLLIGLLIIFIWLIMSWRSHKHASEYYNDTRRKYSKVYDADSGLNRKIRIITLVIGVVLALSSLIVFFGM